MIAAHGLWSHNFHPYIAAFDEVIFIFCIVGYVLSFIIIPIVCDFHSLVITRPSLLLSQSNCYAYLGALDSVICFYSHVEYCFTLF